MMRVFSVVLLVIGALLMTGCGDKANEIKLPDNISQLPDCNPHPNGPCNDVSMAHHRFRFPFELFMIRGNDPEGEKGVYIDNVKYKWGVTWLRLTCCGYVKRQAGVDLQFPRRLMIHFFNYTGSGSRAYDHYDFRDNSEYSDYPGIESFYDKYHQGHGLEDYDDNFWIIARKKGVYGGKSFLAGTSYDVYLLISKGKLLRGRQVVVSCGAGCSAFSLSQPGDSEQNLKIMIQADAFRPEPQCSNLELNLNENDRRYICSKEWSQAEFIKHFPGFLRRFDAALTEWEVVND